MRVQKLIGGNLRRAACLGALMLSGCGVTLGPDDADGPRSTLNLSAIDTADGESTYYEASQNDLFELAEYVEI